MLLGSSAMKVKHCTAKWTHSWSFVRIVNGSGEEEDCKKQFFTHLLKHFFSRIRISKVDLHWKSDLTYLTSNSLYFCGGASQVFMLVLLRNTLIDGCKLDNKDTEDEVKGDLQRLSTPRLAVINSQLFCSSMSNYSTDGHRLSIPTLFRNLRWI
jgi:hypothetical protein